MNLKEHIQSEIKSQLGEARSKKVTKQMWAKMDDDKKIDALLSVVKDPDDAEKYFDKKWNELPSGFERDMTIYESVNEEHIDEKEGVPHYTKDGEEWKGAVHKMPDDSLMSGNPHDVNGSGPDGKSEKLYHKEDLDEKLITFSNRASYGQIVFMAGGAGSGKGFAIDNFIDSAGFKVRDVDDMKKAVGKLDKLGKFSVDKWYKKYGKNLSSKSKDGGLSPKAHVEEFVLGTGMSISDVAADLKSPNNVASLHYIVDAMGLKDKWVINMLSGKTNKETLPNLLFDITAKKVSSITDVIKPLIEAGYDSKNVHLIWVLKNYHAAVKANKTRDRVVPDDILLQTHEGASQTMWQVLTKIKPKGLDGRIDVILNNNKFTAKFVDSNGDEIQVEPNQMNKFKEAQPVVSGFKSLPIKKQGGGIIPEKYWQRELKGWILSNTPDTIDFEELEKPPEEKKK